MDDLRAYPEFQDFQAKSKSSSSRHNDAPEEPITPLEQIAEAVATVEASVADDLLERIRTQEPAFLERAVPKLLVTMGYGGGDTPAAHLGGSGDGGFDGMINQDSLGLERIYIQAKRYAPDNVVGRPAVQGFVGALHGIGAAGGVFITTSRFSPAAIAFAEQVGS